MFKNERLKRLRYQSFKKQPVLTDDSGTQTLERCVLKRVDNLVDGLDLLHQLGERLAFQIDLIQMTSALKNQTYRRRRTRLGLSQDVQCCVAVLYDQIRN